MKKLLYFLSVIAVGSLSQCRNSNAIKHLSRIDIVGPCSSQYHALEGQQVKLVNTSFNRWLTCTIKTTIKNKDGRVISTSTWQTPIPPGGEKPLSCTVVDERESKYDDNSAFLTKYYTYEIVGEIVETRDVKAILDEDEWLPEEVIEYPDVNK